MSSQSRDVARSVESLAPELPAEIAGEANAILHGTVAAEGGRTFRTRRELERALYFLAVLSDNPTWDFLRGG